MKPLRLTYDIVEEGDGQYVGWFNEIDGVVAQGSSHKEVRDELLKVLRIKWDIEREEKASQPNVDRTSVTTEELTLQIA